MICIPIACPDIKDIFPKIDKAVSLGADLIELRLDYVKNLEIDLLKDLKKTHYESIPIIFTYRKSSEGGAVNIGENRRLSIINDLIELKPSYMDLEYTIKKENLAQLVKKCRDHNVKIILSFHNFINTPPLTVLLDTVKQMEKIGHDILKLIVMATDIYDNIIIFELLKQVSKDKKIVSFCMGNFGIVSRIFSPFFGGQFTFASLEVSTAPGQIQILEMKRFHELFTKTIKDNNLK